MDGATSGFLSPNTANVDRKYDRQVRIWGVHGQSKLEAAQVCVLGAGPVATEALKNLVLGGIASFTIVDHRTVHERDLGNNFFLDHDALGQGRAEATTRLLCDLNENVNGSFSDEVLHDLLQPSRNYFKGFSLVIATEVTLTEAAQIAAQCSAVNAMFMHARSHGPYGTLQICGPEMTIIESKPDNTVPDLRLAHPCPELRAFANSIDLESCTNIVHKHVPYAILLIKALDAWREKGRAPPSNSAQKKEFKAMISSWQRTVNGIPAEEENFQEAIDKAHIAWAPLTIQAPVQALLDDPAADVDKGSSKFWLMVAALKRFIEQEGAGALPLEGSIPDMTATTELYLQLQRIYRSKADEHCAAVLQHTQDLLAECGHDRGDVQMEDVKAFCRNARHLRVLRFRCIAAEASAVHADGLRQCIQAEGGCNEGGIYIAMLASSMFEDRFHRKPGEASDIRSSEWELDIATLQSLATSIWQDLGLQGKCLATQEILTEMCRCAGASMHCVASVLGGIVAQEAIKVLLRQFVPVRGVLVYDGICASTNVLDV